MAFTVSDLLAPSGRQALQDERTRLYERGAISYLRSEFAPATRLLVDDELLKVIRLAYHNAQARGVIGDRNHLKYLVPVMFWGSRFEVDPQFFYFLYRARWLNSQGASTGVDNVDDVIAQVNSRESGVLRDTADGGRIIDGFRRIYLAEERAAPNPEFVQRAMYRIWPGRYRLMVPLQRDAFIALNMRHAAALQFFGRDAAAYVCLAMYLGSGFHDDPRFPWVTRSLDDPDMPPEHRRVAFGEAVLAYWDSLSER